MCRFWNKLGIVLSEKGLYSIKHFTVVINAASACFTSQSSPCEQGRKESYLSGAPYRQSPILPCKCKTRFEVKNALSYNTSKLITTVKRFIGQAQSHQALESQIVGTLMNIKSFDKFCSVISCQKPMKTFTLFKQRNFKIHLHQAMVFSKPLLTMICDCFGHLGQQDTQILFVLYHPRWPRQVQFWQSNDNDAGSLTKKCLPM